MPRSCIQGGTTARTESVRNICSWSQRALPGGGRLKPTLPDVSAAAYHLGPSANGFSHDAITNQHQFTDVSCKAVLLEGREAAVSSSISSCTGPRLQRLQGPTFKDQHHLKTDTVDVAIIGADVAGLAAALATVRACPGARVMIYDTAAEPPAPRDGGALLSVNGLRALRSIDSDLYSRLTSHLATSLHESLWYDMEGELVRRTQLGLPSTAGRLSTTPAGNRRRSGPRRTASSTALKAPVGSSLTGPNAAPDPAAPPLMVGLHDLKEAIMEALPPEVLIFGRHHLVRMSPAPGPGGSTQLLFAPAPGADAVRAVRAQVVVGADGVDSAVKRLQGNSGIHQLSSSNSSTSTSATPHSSPPIGRTVWRGRFTLRHRDPDPAHLRRFTIASRTWVDLRAPHGSERQASVAPAGPNTYVWSASCPAELLAARGLRRQGGERAADSAYWRCLAMFEDFPQDFFAALRATSDTSVVEYDVPAVQTSAPAATATAAASVAASLAAPWRWFSGTTALVGESVYPSKADDVNCTAINLALEDAAVLGHAVTQHGLTVRALAEYGRLRGPRVSAMLSLSPSAPERLTIRDAPFLPSLTAPAAHSDSTPLATATSVTSSSLASSSTTGAASTSLPLDTADGNQADAKPQPLTALSAATATYGGVIPSSTDVTQASVATPPLQSSSSPLSTTDMSYATATANHSALQPPETATATNVATAGSTTISTTSATTAEYPSDSLGTPVPIIVPYTADGTPRWVWSTLLDMSGGAAIRHHADVEGSGAAAAAAPSTTGRDAATSTPYDDALSPSMVWMGLLRDATATAAATVEAPVLGASPSFGSAIATASDTTDAKEQLERRQSPATAVAASTSSSASSSSSSATATVAAPAIFYRDPAQGLLPRPVPKQKQAAAASSPPTAPQIPGIATADADAGVTVVATHPMPRIQTEVMSTAAPLLSPPSISTAANNTPAPRSPRGSAAGPLKRRNGTHRGTHTGVSAGTTTTIPHKPKQHPPHNGGGGGGRARTATAASAASAAAQMTVSLSAAAALGGVLSASGADGSHAATAVPELAKALGMHSGAAVAQFWEDLNSLALSSASSLSSLDLS